MFTKLLRNADQDHDTGSKKLKPKLKSLDDIVPLRTVIKSKKKKLKLKHGKVVKSLDDVVPLNSVLGKKVKGSTELESKASSKVAVSVSAQMRNPVLFPAAQTTKPKVTNSQPAALFAKAIVPPPASAFVQSPSHQQNTVVPPSPIPMPLEELRQRSSQGYYPGLPLEERVRKLVQDGCSNDQVAMRLDISIKRVMDLRKEASKQAIVNDPRSLFQDKINDINDAFAEAKKVFFDDPTSETSYKMMNDFAKTLRELMKEYRELEDPKELAQQIARQSIRPLVNTLLSVIVTNMRATIKNVAPFLKVQEQTLLTDSISNGLKTLQAQVNSDYNNSVSVLEQIFNVDLSNLKIHEVPKQEQETTEQTEPGSASVEAETTAVVVVVEK